ncbi:hypothetical protein [Fulvivirga ligni]|uniref:hypothetical protein n=1 Tax=Fulvivirga ligni TaxID=2904246 RepID=UPI001F37C048|nr:hypothetical protein [Fulvivirga ligni]UII23314.1 hypothetical protein LVD16_08755 [Fulvivirga ligni]
MRKLLTLPLFALWINISYAQTYLTTRGDNNAGASIEYRLFNDGDTDMEGSPYINKEWLPGKIITSTGLEISVDQLNYHIARQILTFKENGKELTPQPTLIVHQFTLGLKKFEKIIYNNKKEAFQVLVESESGIDLLKGFNISIQPGKASNGIIQATPDKYVQKESYFYRNSENSSLIEFKPSKKETLSLFGNKSSQMKNFISANKLNTRKEEDLIQIFNHYNTL